MTDFSIGRTQGVNEVRPSSTTLATTTATNTQLIQYPRGDKQKQFEIDMQNSKLDDRIPTQRTLSRMGFNVPFQLGGVGSIPAREEPYLLDMNGGKTYQNANGDSIRIANFEAEVATGMKGATSVEFKSKDGKNTESILYDPEGNPLKGKATIEKEDGSITTYEYEFDLNGKKIVKSESTMVHETQEPESTSPTQSPTSVEKPEAPKSSAPTRQGRLLVEAMLKDNMLGSSFVTGAELEKQGFEKSQIMDMNGGVYYTNKKTGERVRVQEDEHFQKSNTYYAENYRNFVACDKDGKPTHGVFQFKQKDGTIKVFEYTIDGNGKRTVTSEKVSEFDYFADYD